MTVWDSLPGSPVVSRLERNLAEGAIAHAWLILGPPGSGKAATADVMAAALICPVRPRVGCGECSTCSRVLRRAHPDVHRISPEGSIIAVDAIRDTAIVEAARSAFEARSKVFVIEGAERMNEPAQNALLKTLEEPQPDTIFILTSEQDDEVLETIRSRCRVVRLEPLPERRLIELLESDGAAHEQAVAAARLSQGDAARARELALDASKRKRRALWLTLPGRLCSPTDALDAAGEVIDNARAASADRRRQQAGEIRELSDVLGEGRGTATARNALVLRHRRELRHVEEEVLGEALTTLATFFRDVVALRSRSRGTVINIDHLDELERWADAGAKDVELVTAVERLVMARAALLANANVALTLESAFASLVGLGPSSAIGAGHAVSPSGHA